MQIYDKSCGGFINGGEIVLLMIALTSGILNFALLKNFLNLTLSCDLHKSNGVRMKLLQ